MFSKTGRILFSILLLFFCYLMLRISLPYLSFKPNVSFLRTKQGIIHLRHWRWAFYAHVISSTFVLLLGIIQFLPYMLQRFPAFHRLAGKIYLVLVLGISGPGGLIIGFYANGGWPARISFVLLSLLWIGFTANAYRLARRKQYLLHGEYMIRSFSLTLSAITLRLYAYLLPGIILLKPHTAYICIAWISWIPNLLIAEAVIRYGRRRRTRTSLSLPKPEEHLPG